eukprot:m.39089 g.39089  ORF g.39089 m.39089 type:complete len:106 (+) comp11557_c0_seq2:67-384(+)
MFTTAFSLFFLSFSFVSFLSFLFFAFCCDRFSPHFISFLLSFSFSLLPLMVLVVLDGHPGDAHANATCQQNIVRDDERPCKMAKRNKKPLQSQQQVTASLTAELS